METPEDRSDPSWARYAVIGGLGLLGVLSCHWVRHGHLNADEGFYLNASRLVRDHFLPYRDFGFTQCPLLAYLNVPFLEATGYTIEAQRWASWLWTIACVGTACVWLKSKAGYLGSAYFIVACVGAPTWLAYSVKGKTYAAASLFIVLGVIFCWARGSWWLRWLGFVIASGVGIGIRLPLAPFFLLVGLILLRDAPTAKARWAGLLFAVVCATCELVLISGGMWRSFLFWTLQFHRESTFVVPVTSRWGGAAMFVPAAWIVAIGSVVHFWRTGRSTELLLLSAGLVAAVVNLSTRSTYAEYVFPLLPAIFLVGVFGLAQVVRPKPVRLQILIAIALLLAGWASPPAEDRDVLTQTKEAEHFLRQSIPAGSTVVASMPEIPVAAGMKVPLLLAMGKFSLTEEMSASEAQARLMITPDQLESMLRDSQTQALVLSVGRNWNFSWSLPSYRLLSQKAQTSLRETVMKHFHLGFSNSHYAIFLRRKD